MKTYLLLAGALVMSVASTVSSTAAEKPNVLMICIDDMRPQLGAYGHEIMMTPNLDRLASQGRLFNRHYSQVPTCGPSRACMLTGKNLNSKDEISHPHLAKTLEGTVETDQPETFIHHFKQNGYHTVGTGKISHSISGSHQNKKTKTYGYELPHSWDEFISASDAWQKYVGGQNPQKEKMPPFECLDVEDDAYPDGRTAMVAVDSIKKLAATDKPFFLAVGFLKPHLPFCAPKKYWDLYDREQISISPNPDSPNNVSGVFLHDSSEFFDQYPGGREMGGAGKRLSDEYAKELRHGYFASVSYVDAQVGKILNQLKASGLDRNTIIVVWGDHGWHLGDHTIWGKHSTFEKALNSLLMIKIPGMPQPGIPTDGLVAAIDIYPTLCELTGLPQPEGLDGESFADVVNDPADPGKTAVLSYWRDILSLRTDRYRMALYHDGKKQTVMLFDHVSDPNETRNIAAEHPEVVQRLTNLIKQKNNNFLPSLDK